LGSVASNEATLTVVDPYGATRLGYLLKQTWININGIAITDLTNSDRYPGIPDSISFINKFEIPSNIGDHFGVRVSGWIIAPETGDYTFYFASDDNGQLKLSSDSLPSNLSTASIASVPDWTDSRQFDKFPEQTSATISLVAGKKYFVEALYKEEAGGDNMAVAWKLPSGITESPIPSQRLAFYTTLSTGVKNVLVNENDDLILFPSPANDILKLKSSSLNGAYKLVITDILGRVVRTKEVEMIENSVVEIVVSDLKSGIYIVNVYNQGKSTKAKFIVSH